MTPTAILDDAVFRDAMAELPAGVAVITARDRDQAPVGATVSSMTSLSMDPPLVIVCLSRSSDTCRALRAGDAFAVHVLQQGQEQIAAALAGKGAAKFDAVSLVPGDHDAPLIAGCAVTIRCLVERLVPGGDHMIVVGEVRHAVVHGGSPLLYHRRVIKRIPD
jgi:flavin reductase (DIM6/NTAB) family NADH-FMN oxidoreductase RutF